MPRRAWVLGGTGTVGRAVVRLLRAREIETAFTYLRSEDAARELALETGASAVSLDLTDHAALRARLREADADVLIHCAAVPDGAPFAKLSDARFDHLLRLSSGALFAAVQTLAPRWIEARRADVVMVGALAPGQSLPLPVGLATANGAATAMVMALAKELGRHGVRLNSAVLGPLESGLGTTLEQRTKSDYLAFSALQRVGRAEEAARAIIWLALDDRAMNGKSLAIQGGI